MLDYPVDRVGRELRVHVSHAVVVCAAYADPFPFFSPQNLVRICHLERLSVADAAMCAPLR
jgi:hypothetical protein